MADPYPTCWLNGAYLPLAEARVSPLDRGFLFADGAYEVVPVHRGRPFRMRHHLERFDRSLASYASATRFARAVGDGHDELVRAARRPNCSCTCR